MKKSELAKLLLQESFNKDDALDSTLTECVDKAFKANGASRSQEKLISNVVDEYKFFLLLNHSLVTAEALTILLNLENDVDLNNNDEITKIVQAVK